MPPLLTRDTDLGLGGRGSHLVIPSIIGPVFAALLVFNRVYWRIALVNALGHDDVCILLSLVFLFAQCTVNIVGVDAGYGRPASTLTPDQLHRALQMFYLDQIFYKASINLTKLSILTLYLRIFSQRWFRLTCIILATLIFAYATASVLATIFQCSPLARVWDKSIVGTCLDTTAFWYANAIFNILTDVVILLSVPGVVWGLKLPLRQRLALTGVFGLGVFVFATSILRFTTLSTSSKSEEPSAGTLKSTMWTAIEASSAVICACLPMVRTPLQRVWPRLFPGRSGANTIITTSTGTRSIPIGGEKGGRGVEIAMTESPAHSRIPGNTKADKILGRDVDRDLEADGNQSPVNFTYPRLSVLSNTSPIRDANEIKNPRIRPSTSRTPTPLDSGYDPANNLSAEQANQGKSRSQISSVNTNANTNSTRPSLNLNSISFDTRGRGGSEIDGDRITSSNITAHSAQQSADLHSFSFAASDTDAAETDWYSSTSGARAKHF